MAVLKDKFYFASGRNRLLILIDRIHGEKTGHSNSPTVPLNCKAPIESTVHNIMLLQKKIKRSQHSRLLINYNLEKKTMIFQNLNTGITLDRKW